MVRLVTDAWLANGHRKDICREREGPGKQRPARQLDGAGEMGPSSVKDLIPDIVSCLLHLNNARLCPLCLPMQRTNVRLLSHTGRQTDATLGHCLSPFWFSLVAKVEALTIAMK